MKITLDTDKIKLPSWSLKEYSDREVFFICVTVLMFAYVASDYFDSIKYTSVNTRLSNVEVTLDRIVNQLNTDIIERDVGVKDHIYNLPKESYLRLVNTHQQISLNEKEFDCLSRNIYWESMHEPLIGQIAVAHVTHNRVKSGKWGESFCEVVFAKKQFSWTNFKKIRNAKPKNMKQWERAKHSAILFSKGVRVNNLDNTQFYYADYIKKPKWAYDMTKDAKIGQHIFYTASNQ